MLRAVTRSFCLAGEGEEDKRFLDEEILILGEVEKAPRLKPVSWAELFRGINATAPSGFALCANWIITYLVVCEIDRQRGGLWISCRSFLSGTRRRSF